MSLWFPIKVSGKESSFKNCILLFHCTDNPLYMNPHNWKFATPVNLDFVQLFFPFGEWGIFTSDMASPQYSSIVNLLSAMTASPGSSRVIKPLFSVITWSDAWPPQQLLIKETVPYGVMPVKNLIVLWCLYFDQVCALSSKSYGCSINISVQSIIIAHFLKKTF